jgi:NitT/TauT family transport system permease protein
MGIALIVAVTVEIVVNPQGLGYGLVISQQSLNPAKMLAYLLWLGIIGWILNLALSKLEYIFSYYE